MVRQLTGPEKTILKDALVQHYDTFTIKEFTEYRLDKKFVQFAPPFAPSLDTMFWEFVNQFNLKGWHVDLVNAFLAEHPAHEAVLKLAFQLGIGPKFYDSIPANNIDAGGLQNLLNANPFLDVSVLLKEISRIERCVCRVEIQLNDDTQKWGTGFLVGPDLLLSNYHVFRELIEKPETVKNIICRFDYNVSADGTNIFQGLTYQLAVNPIIESSPNSPLDVTGSPNLNIAWPTDKLDYALVRLEKPVADETFGIYYGDATSSASKRGFISAPAVKPKLFNGGHLFIVQHPEKMPKKIAFGFGMLEGTDDAEQRVRYKVNTLHGSSGSPCFNEKYQWIALHNMGDPLWNPTYNQGIPAFRIIEDLQKKGITLP